MKINNIVIFLLFVAATACCHLSENKDQIDGIDVSHYQGKINWSDVRKSRPDIAFVYVKCSEGKDYVDKAFKKNAEGAVKNGFKVGAYHYFRMTSSAHDQFKNFRRQMSSVSLSLRPMVDVERSDGKPRKELQDSLRVLLTLLEKEYGVKPIIYGTNRTYNTFCAPEFNDYPLYIGRFGKLEPVLKGPSRYTVWQYSENGKIKGIPNAVDLCRFHPGKGMEDLLLPEETVAPEEMAPAPEEKTPAQARPEAVKTHMFHPELADMDEDYNYYYFGKIGYNVKAFREDTLCFPPIKGLVHESVFAMCPADTCFAQYAVLALRCPPVQPLLKWVADTVDHFVRECPVGGHLKTRQGKGKSRAAGQFKSDREILDKYIYKLRHVYDGWHCPGERDHAYVNEQEGLLLADCWHNGNLYTFYRLIWYDFLSCGNNVRVSYYTVDATSGRRLGLSDFILPGKQESLADLVASHLTNGRGINYFDRLKKKPDNNDVLQRADGCALIADGLIIYYYPYNLSYGADGQFEAVIPYEELEGILRPGIIK